MGASNVLPSSSSGQPTLTWYRNMCGVGSKPALRTVSVSRISVPPRSASIRRCSTRFSAKIAAWWISPSAQSTQRSPSHRSP